MGPTFKGREKERKGGKEVERDGGNGMRVKEKGRGRGERRGGDWNPLTHVWLYGAVHHVVQIGLAK